jgi:hypothetical protein
MRELGGKPMSPQMKQSLHVLIGVGLIVLTSYLVYELVNFFVELLKALDPNLAGGLVTASTTIFVSIIAITLGKYFERKKEVESHFREKKVQIYDEFLIEFYKLFSLEDENRDTEEKEPKSDLDLVPLLRDWQRKIILWGGADVVSSYIKWMKHISTNEPNAHSIFLTEDFFKALRKDIGLSSKGLIKGDLIHLILRNSDLFLTLAKKNPNITLAEIGKIEAQQKTPETQKGE